MVTQKMIAQKCGCSVSAVCKALNNAPDIGEDTRDYIRKVANEMGYVPNAAARMLKTSRSYNFGVLFQDAANMGLTHSFFSHILNSFKRKAEELGYDISFISNSLGGKEISYVDHAHYRNCDGILVASVDYREPAVLELANSGIPVVTIDYIFDNCTSVVSDNVGGIAELVRYVHSKGHRKIAFIHGDDSAVTRQRIASFYRTCKELEVEVPEEYLIPSIYLNANATEKATKQLLELSDPPTCIFYPDDVSYIGGLNEMERRGVSVPEDISVVGYDGAAVAQMLKPSLTTLKQDTERLGAFAAVELAKAVEEGRTYIPNRVVVPGKLLIGNTVRDLTAV